MGVILVWVMVETMGVNEADGEAMELEGQVDEPSEYHDLRENREREP